VGWDLFMSSGLPLSFMYTFNGVQLIIEGSMQSLKAYWENISPFITGALVLSLLGRDLLALSLSSMGGILFSLWPVVIVSTALASSRSDALKSECRDEDIENSNTAPDDEENVSSQSTLLRSQDIHENTSGMWTANLKSCESLTNPT
jgi:hypothetical protein